MAGDEVASFVEECGLVAGRAEIVREDEGHGLITFRDVLGLAQEIV